MPRWIRLAKCSRHEHAPRTEFAPILNFFMGKNTPERKDYIMDKLVVRVEERGGALGLIKLCSRCRSLSGLRTL